MASLRSPCIPPVLAGSLWHWRQSVHAVQKHDSAVPGRRAHYVFYFLIIVPDSQQHKLCLSEVVIE